MAIGLKQENTKWLASVESGCLLGDFSRFAVGVPSFPFLEVNFVKRCFFSFQNAMRVIGLSNEQINDVHLVLASILQLGNISFITTGGAQVQDKNGR